MREISAQSPLRGILGVNFSDFHHLAGETGLPFLPKDDYNLGKLSPEKTACQDQGARRGGNMKSVTTRLNKFQYFYPYTVALVGARAGSQVNFMSCAWHTALSFDPPLFGILISKKRFTHQIISEAREFTANFISFERIKLSAQMGRTSGLDRDKVKEFGVKTAPSQIIASPIIEEAYVALECKLAEVQPYGDHDLFVGEVLAVHEDPDVFDAEGTLNASKVRPLLYLGSDFYITIDPDTFKHVVPD
jgi:flavin reductase (DIM6/NTAB) family NADH-FMN oxidoreductase RutF